MSPKSSESLIPTHSSSAIKAPQRPTVFRAAKGRNAAVVSVDHEASQWGMRVIDLGGNAIDAAVATAFYLSVSRPMYAALGGGGFLVYCPPPIALPRPLKSKKTSKETTAQATSPSPRFKPSPCEMNDFRETAPKAVHSDLFREVQSEKPNASQRGPLASGVPGLVAGLLKAHQRHGKLKRNTLLSLEKGKRSKLFNGLVKK